MLRFLVAQAPQGLLTVRPLRADFQKRAAVTMSDGMIDRRTLLIAGSGMALSGFALPVSAAPDAALVLRIEKGVTELGRGGLSCLEWLSSFVRSPLPRLMRAGFRTLYLNPELDAQDPSGPRPPVT
jgi:hypothetical protein